MLEKAPPSAICLNNKKLKKIEFLSKRGNDSTSVDYHSMLKKCKFKKVINNLTVDVSVDFRTFSKLKRDINLNSNLLNLWVTILGYMGNPRNLV